MCPRTPVPLDRRSLEDTLISHRRRALDIPPARMDSSHMLMPMEMGMGIAMGAEQSLYSINDNDVHSLL